ncbi:MAG: tetratricopeptide repeat protein [Boseongicola sp.]|nr:MAG: tetratricopeptide repeat protein [Boseongicola sp.]
MRLRQVFMIVGAIAAGGPVIADGNAGAYLAARSAIIDNDYAEASRQFTRALLGDSTNPVILENGMTAYLGLGDLERAAPMARRLDEMDIRSQLADLVLLGDVAARGEWETALDYLNAGNSVGPLFDGLVRAWSELGAGRVGDAIASFDAVATSDGVQAFGLYHKALALASVGDYEGAAEIFSGDSGPNLRLTRRGIIAYSQVLSQLERNEDALEIVGVVAGNAADPTMLVLQEQLASGETLTFDAVRSPTDGVAEVYHSIAGALRGEAQDAYTLLYGRMALALRSDHVDALLLTAELLESLDQYELATQVYDTVPRDAPAFYAAELGRAAALRQADRNDEAVEVLRQLAESHADIPLVHVNLGDTLRGLDRFEEAIGAYDAAIELIVTPEEQHWIMYFARGIVHERTDQWENAETDFRKALELRPEQPQVLNYLGYSFLEMQLNLDEALDMIERAVALRPESGYIIDSLGWGLYRLGRYDEAVGHMERAVELMAIDPVVNDHLGDVYWAVGRFREAEFQWHRALSFIGGANDNGDADPDRIRRKLDVGLDQVLEEEGESPLRMANDG